MADVVHSVLIVDDHELVVYALSKVLSQEDDLNVVGTTGDPQRALALLDSCEINVIVLDRRLADGVDAIEWIAPFRERSPGVRVLMLSGSGDDRSVARALDAGCCGYLLKDQPVHDVVAGVRSAARGEMVFAPSVLAKVMKLLRPQSSRDDDLSAREVEVLQLLAEGSSTEQIAGVLFISNNTVRNHVNAIMRKLGVHSRLEAVSHGIKSGLVDLR